MANHTRKEAEQILSERYDYYLEQMKQKDCFDISGELQVKETATGFEGTAEVIYSKIQDTYQEIAASVKKKKKTV